MSKRIAVLASGGGSNLQAIFAYFDTLSTNRPGDVVLVASDQEKSSALDRGRVRGVAAMALDTIGRGPGLLPLFRQHGIDLIVLAGYLRHVPPDVTREFRGRIVNVHPALLPAFGGPGMYGQHVHRAVLERGVRLSGVTVHFVDEVYDQGPIIAQWPVPILPNDTPDSLARRVLAIEHIVYPRVVQALAAGRVHLDGGNRVHFDAHRGAGAYFVLEKTEAAAVEAISDAIGAGRSETGANDANN